ncbi:penicillin-binding protein 2 [Candidatus Gottesmanbacteria bacterium]|nr:penicillin-binding protein 2 [Candidatus Gottesmanbacteria bacterium]
MWRIWTVFIFICSVFISIVFRLFYWQIVRGDYFRTQAASQYYQEFLLPAKRGSILANDMKPLVISQVAHLVYAEPKKIANPEKLAGDITSILSIDKQEILSKLTNRDKAWVALAHRVEYSKTDLLKSFQSQGIGFEQDSKRYYPEASMASHLLGFVGYDDQGRDKGYFGLEGYYDRELTGKSGKLQLEKDARGSPILISDSVRIEPEDGRTLVLWVDRTIQRAVEERLSEAITKYGAKEGSIVVIDPKTGGVIAMVHAPSYDPAMYTSYAKDLYKNPIVNGAYEPGSTFKTLVMAAAIEENLITPITTVDEKGPVKVGDYTIRTWNNEYHGQMTTSQILEYSSNVGMVHVSKKLGKEKLVTYISYFGFGEKTHIDLEDEATPLLRDINEWKEIDLATASFGQGIAVTPIQMVTAVASLANGGFLMEPHLVKEIRDSSGKVYTIKPKTIRRIVSQKTADTVTEMMVSAVDNGEAKWAKPKGYRIAGKTGTAQIPVAGHYDADKTIASFVGFGPSDNPRFVMLVTLREPTTSPWGSETAAPLFFSIARDIFGYYGIAPQ